MSTVVVTRTHLVTDTMAIRGCGVGKVYKIHFLRTREGAVTYGAGVGNIDELYSLIHWLDRVVHDSSLQIPQTKDPRLRVPPSRYREDPHSEVIVCSNHSKRRKVWRLNSRGYPMEITKNLPYAIGSGCEFAMGALLQGASAEEAVEIACKLDTYSATPIDTVQWHPSI